MDNQMFLNKRKNLLKSLILRKMPNSKDFLTMEICEHQQDLLKVSISANSFLPLNKYSPGEFLIGLTVPPHGINTQTWYIAGLSPACYPCRI